MRNIAAILVGIGLVALTSVTAVDADPNLPVTATPGAVVAPAEGATEIVTQEPTAPPPATATPAPVSNLIGPDEYPEGVNPLTGLTVDDPAVLNRLPIIAKMSNAPALVRPQAGVGEADLVYEHYAEGGLTRLTGVFYSRLPQRVGSVRSARLIDYELAPMYQAILAFSGGSTGVEERIYGTEATGIVEARQAEGKPILPPSDFAERAYKGVIYGPPYYYRDETIPVPHNLFVNLQALSGLATNDGINTVPQLRGMAFSQAVPAGEAGPANLLDVRYRATRAQWTYNPERGVYLRMSDGQLHFDANINEQVNVENVVVIYADHYFTDIVESEWQGSRSYSIEIKVWFEGDALLVRDGRYYEARWIRPTRESLISLQTPDGQPLPLKPGQTWFQLVRLPEQMEPESEWVRVE